jgi:tetratricopeptide (TPR) repeat protein
VPRVRWWNDVPRAADRNKSQSASDNVFKLLLGEGRRLFGNEMFDMADSYFHSGYYPSIFDGPVKEHDVAERTDEKSEDADSTSDSFLGPPPDWIAALDRQFVPNRHTHLSTGGPSGDEKAASVQEILPWLKLATDMNPQFVKAYRVGYYWLRRLHKPAEARDFLFEGLRNNPSNAELLFDLGWLYQQDFHDTNRARNVWMAALRSWERQNASAKADPEAQLIYEETAMNLARLEENEGHWSQAIKYLKLVKQVSPHPDAIQKQIDEVEKKTTPGK